eukprot:TRINITY_DN30280_c0_g1_i1.p1 TRINITY_DN30280_c0_g1~~TRINITY_DN30280_c0_g1_i1.p1  ORF type:complete len:211 (+),score=31.78 TRINITY_DN30280_c0_g1_i1:72-704(+)
MTHQTKFTAAIPAVGVSTSGTLTVPILPTKANELEKANEGSPLPEHRFSERQKQHAMRRRTCAHNAWDNVRVSKGLMTLRCRECQRQWRADVELVWGGLKCLDFGGEEGCAEGDSCSKLHIHHRKLSLEDRVKQHGCSVLQQVKASRITRDALQKVRKIETQLATGEFPPTSPPSPPVSCSSISSSCSSSQVSQVATPGGSYTHNPYAWE